MTQERKEEWWFIAGDKVTVTFSNGEWKTGVFKCWLDDSNGFCLETDNSYMYINHYDYVERFKP
jgi:hypothetical protein